MTDRGVSISLNYALAIMISTMLMAGLMLSTGDVLENRRESSARTELRVVGQQLVADLMAIDRLVQAGGDDVSYETSIPRTVAGLQYTVSVNATADGSELVLVPEGAEVVVEVSFSNATAVENTEVFGGDVEIRLTDDGELEVSQA